MIKKTLIHFLLTIISIFAMLIAFSYYNGELPMYFQDRLIFFIVVGTPILYLFYMASVTFEVLEKLRLI